MAIRKRKWTTSDGDAREAWVFDYVDQAGKRRLKTFDRRRDAEQYAANTKVQLSKGTHVPDSASITVREAGELWLNRCRADGLEQGTIDQYEQHLRLHICPYIGTVKLSQLTVPYVSEFRDRLSNGNSALPDDDTRRLARSHAMVRGVMGSLSSLLADAHVRGRVAYNAVRALPRMKRKDRHKPKLVIGVDIPTPDEVRRLIDAAEGKWRPFLMTAVFTGLRASELRGLRWDDVDLSAALLHVRQRADKYNVIGSPKSRSGKRTIPLPPATVRELREWKLACPKKDGRLALVFPNGAGNTENYVNIAKRGLEPTMLAAGITRPVLDKHGVGMRDEAGRPIVQPKYTGLHTLRHFFASWCINRKEDGGRGLPGKVVQELLGHSSITMTMDTYGHLFPRGDDAAEMAAAERLLLSR